MSVWPQAVIGEDHVVTRAGIRRALEHAHVAVAEEAGDAEGVVHAVRKLRPEVCLLAGQIPGGGIAAASEIAEMAPATRVVMLLEEDCADDVLAALRAGASGCLLKDIGPSALGRAVHAVLDGEVPLPRALIAHVVDELQRGWRGGCVRTREGTWVALSERESEVLRLMHRKLTTKQIAERLGISTVTVRRHVSDTVRRLGVRDRDAALRLTGARRSGRSSRRESRARL